MKSEPASPISRRLRSVHRTQDLVPPLLGFLLALISAPPFASVGSTFVSQAIPFPSGISGSTPLQVSPPAVTTDSSNPMSATATNRSANTISGSAVATHAVTNPIIGINVSGAEYSWETYPTTSDLDYLKSNGITLLRVPFAWEKIQPTIYGPLSSTELGNMNAFLTALAARGMSAIIDMHNYARYTLNWATLDNIGTGTEGTTGSIIGSAAVPFSSFKDVWTKLAAALKGHSGLVGYDIMNEPNTMPNASVWPTAAQAAVDGIRSVDMNTTIYVEGDNWASASRWQTANANLHIVDPASRLVYEAHQYFDDGSGKYTKTYDQYGATPTRGTDQLQPFLKWLKQNDAKGFVGEFGVPQDDPCWLAVLDNFIAALVANNVGGTYWQYNYRTPQGVPWWPNWHEPMSVIRIQDWGTPQLGVIKKYVQPASKGTP